MKRALRIVSVVLAFGRVLGRHVVPLWLALLWWTHGDLSGFIGSLLIFGAGFQLGLVLLAIRRRRRGAAATAAEAAFVDGVERELARAAGTYAFCPPCAYRRYMAKQGIQLEQRPHRCPENPEVLQ